MLLLRCSLSATLASLPLLPAPSSRSPRGEARSSARAGVPLMLLMLLLLLVLLLRATARPLRRPRPAAAGGGTPRGPWLAVAPLKRARFGLVRLAGRVRVEREEEEEVFRGSGGGGCEMAFCLSRVVCVMETRAYVFALRRDDAWLCAV